MNNLNDNVRIGLAITGASGVIYGFRLLEELLRRHVLVHLTISPTAAHIAQLELNRTIDLETGSIQGMDDLFQEMGDLSSFYTYRRRAGFGILPFKSYRYCSMQYGNDGPDRVGDI